MSPDLIDALNWRVYLSRLRPPLTPEEAETWTCEDQRAGVTRTVADLRERAEALRPLTEVYLTHLRDMGRILPEWG